jgi:hypothetical protein
MARGQEEDGPPSPVPFVTSVRSMSRAPDAAKLVLASVSLRPPAFGRLLFLGILERGR